MKKQAFLVFIFFSFVFEGIAQILITPGVSNAALIQSLAGQGLNISNITMHCNPAAYGSFSNGTGSVVGLNNGLLLTSGGAILSADPNDADGKTDCWDDTLIDADLITLEPLAIIDPCILEFDIVPQCDQLTIRYVFGSEEYPEYVSAGFNDAFGFFISGPNPLGGNYSSLNIAKLPNGTIASIDNINNLVNSSFYIDNTNGLDCQYDGLTQQISSVVSLVPCQTYHFKIAIADAGDCAYDSGVFIDFLECTSSTSVTATANPATCGSNNGTATATVISTASAISYVWSPQPLNGQGTASVSGLIAGVTYTVTVNDNTTCNSGPSASVTIPGSAATTVNTIQDITVCAGATIPTSVFSSPVGGTTFNWSNNNASIGLSISGSGNLPSFVALNSGVIPIIATITVVPIIAGCPGQFKTFTITVNPKPNISAPILPNYCDGDNTGIISFSSNVPGTFFNWTCSNTAIALLNGGGPLPASGSGFIPDLQLVNNTNSIATSVFTVTPSFNTCVGNALSFPVNVNPAIVPNTIANIHVCAGDLVTVPAFTSNVSGAIFSWQNPKPSIGLASSGTGNIPTFNAINTTSNTITVKIDYSASPCSNIIRHFNIIIDPALTINTIANQTVCNGTIVTSINFSSNATGTIFNWTNSNSNIGLAATGSGNINSFNALNNGSSNEVATILVSASNGICASSNQSFTITVQPGPTLNPMSALSFCDGSIASVPIFSSIPSGATFTWSNNNTLIGLPTSGSGNIPNFIASNGTANLIDGLITVVPQINNCIGNSQSFLISIKPKPSVVATPNQIFCSGDIAPSTTFSSIPPGANFSWNNSNTSNGLTNSGIGNVPSFTAINQASTVSSSIVSVVPTLNACTGTALNYSITVKPKPITSAISNLSVCSGDLVPSIFFSSIPIGATFTWTNSNNAIGLPASGINNIASFTPLNSDSLVISSVVSITPVLNSCIGDTTNFNIHVKPIPQLLIPSDKQFCADEFVSAINFLSVPSLANYSWTNSNTTIGIGPSGSGNIPSFTANNNTANSNTASISVDVSLNGCIGPSENFTIVVLPKPRLSPISNLSVCSGESVSSVLFSSNLVGTNFTWTNDNISIGMGGSGTGNIPSFTATNTGSNFLLSNITVLPINNGCIGPIDTFTIQVKPLPVAILPQDILACPGAIISPSQFSSMPLGANFTWSNNNINIGLLSSGSGNLPVFTAVNPSLNLDSASISVSPTLNACIGLAASFYIKVQPTARAIVPSDITICAKEEVPIIPLTAIPASSAISWIASNTSIGIPSMGIGDISGFTAKNTSGIQTTSDVIVTPVFKGCKGTPAHFTINVNPKPVADFTYSPNPIGILNPIVSFNETCLYSDNFNWDFGDGFNSVLKNPTHVYQDTGCYENKLIVTNLEGCSDTTMKRLCVQNDFAIYIPNAFSPNGDNINDVFLPKGNGISPNDYELLIFDRWGLLLFISNNLSKGWDGTSNNLMVKSSSQIDTYIYKISCRDSFNKAHDFIGQVNLIR